MKLYPLIFLAVFLMGVASADVSIVNDVLFNLENNAFIKVLAVQNSTNITLYNSTDTPASTLQFYINGTPIRFTANTNKTLSNISYNNVADIATYTGNGTTGYLNVSARMNISSVNYGFKVDGVINQTSLSNNSGWVTFNYTGWSQNQHDFEISRVSYGVNLTNISTLVNTTPAGTNSTYLLNLTNNGTATDTYIITVSNIDGATTVGTNIISATLNTGLSQLFTLNVTNTAAGTFRVNVTATSANDATKFGYINTTTTVNPASYLPSSPTGLSSTQGNFWINYTWSAGSGNNTDYYNVSVNGTWTNGSSTTYTNNSGLSPHGWSNISVYSYNTSGTGTLNQTGATQTTQVSNNPVTIGNVLTSYTLTAGDALSISPTSSDPDIDTPVFARNFTDGTFYANNGTLLWPTTGSDVGIHSWRINVTDGYGSVSSANFTVTVALVGAPNLTSWGNNKTNNSSLNLTVNISESVRFNATANQSIDTWNWYKDDMNQNKNYDNITTSFTSAGSHTIKVNATNNSNGTSSTITWSVTVTTAALTPTPAPTPVQAVTVGGGGGGAGVISPEPPSNIEMFEIMDEYLGADVPTSYISTAPNLAVSEVLITPARNFGTTSVRVEMLKDLSKIERITSPFGIVYKYVNIWVGAKELEREDGIIDAFIGFKVELDWLAENNLPEDSIRLLRWDGSKWDSLDTVQTRRDETFIYYEAKTYAFSPFAIVAVPTYPSVTAQVVETPTLIKIPIQKIIELKNNLWGYILIALILISLALYKVWNYKIAVKVPKATEIKPETTKPEDADTWYDKGFSLSEQGNYEEAIKAYDKAIEIIRRKQQ